MISASTTAGVAVSVRTSVESNRRWIAARDSCHIRRNDVVVVRIERVRVVRMRRVDVGRCACAARSRARESGAGALVHLNVRGTKSGPSRAIDVDVVIVQRSSVKACSCECGGHSSIMFQPPRAAATPDSKQYPKKNRGRCQSNDHENAGHCSCILKER